MQQRLATARATPRANTMLMGLMGSIALTLAVVGLLGLLSYIVSQRTHEIGIRIALGAQERDVAAATLGHGLALTGIGVVLGLAVTPAFTRVLGVHLPGVGAADPTMLAAVAFLFIIVAAGACYAPAARAARVDPMTTLRHD